MLWGTLIDDNHARDSSEPLISYYPTSDPVADFKEPTTNSPLPYTASDGAGFSQFQSENVYNPQFSHQDRTEMPGTKQHYTQENQYREEEQNGYLENSMRTASDHQKHLEQELQKLKEAENMEANDEKERNEYEASEVHVEASHRSESELDIQETQVKEIVQEEQFSYLTSTSAGIPPPPSATDLYNISPNETPSGQDSPRQESTDTHGIVNYGGETSSNSIISSKIVDFSETTRFSLQQETVDDAEEINEEIEGEENTTEKDKLSDDDFQF